VEVDGSQRGRFQEWVHQGEVSLHVEDVFQVQPGSGVDRLVQAPEVKVDPYEVCARFLLGERAGVLPGPATDLELKGLM
jgi:hypothetical protein